MFFSELTEIKDVSNVKREPKNIFKVIKFKGGSNSWKDGNLLVQEEDQW